MRSSGRTLLGNKKFSSSSNSKAPHFNYVGDSVVGFGANLAGVKLSNVRHDKSDIAVSLED